ncbi:hypothetical protein D3C84_852700 [compost metagenome]
MADTDGFSWKSKTLPIFAARPCIWTRTLFTSSSDMDTVMRTSLSPSKPFFRSAILVRISSSDFWALVFSRSLAANSIFCSSFAKPSRP